MSNREDPPALRALIVDDEQPARVRVRALLASHGGIAITECGNGADAVGLIREQRPDLLFLDVQMPALDGFGVLRQLSCESRESRSSCEVGESGELGAWMPVTIFITAYDRYAVRAFDAHALDYLMKPFTDERFELALSRALSHLRLRQRDELARRMLALVHENGSANGGLSAMPDRRPLQPPTGAAGTGGPALDGLAGSDRLDRLVVRAGKRVLFLRPEEIDWVEAAGVYVYLHVGEEKYLHRASLTALDGRLAAAGFVRIHRSALVNFERIRELSPHTHGEFGVTLNDGRRLRLTRSFRSRLEDRLGHPL